MRQSLFVGVLGTFLAVALLFPFLKSDAKYAPAQKTLTAAGPRLPPATLPNYDIRLVGRGEFTDYDLNSADGNRSAARNAVSQARVSAVDEFRSSLKSEKAGKVRAEVNEAGAMKNFFNDGATLSEPQADTADNIARGFLKNHQALFVLSDAEVAGLALANEDIDGGTTFIKYVQTVGGIKVFEGGVQVAVNQNGEVLSVREGFLVSGQAVKLRPAVSERDRQSFRICRQECGPLVCGNFPARLKKRDVAIC